MMLIETRRDNPLGCDYNITYTRYNPTWTSVAASNDDSVYPVLQNTGSKITIKTDINGDGTVQEKDIGAATHSSGAQSTGCDDNLTSPSAVTRTISCNIGMMLAHDASPNYANSNYDYAYENVNMNANSMRPSIAPLEYGLTDTSVPLSGRSSCRHTVSAQVLFGPKSVRAAGTTSNWAPVVGSKILNKLNIKQRESTAHKTETNANGTEQSTSKSYWKLEDMHNFCDNVQNQGQPYIQDGDDLLDVSNKMGMYLVSEDGNTGATQVFQEETGGNWTQEINFSGTTPTTLVKDESVDKDFINIKGTSSKSKFGVGNGYLKTLKLSGAHNEKKINAPEYFLGADRCIVDDTTIAAEAYKKIEAFANNGSGKVRLTITGHGFVTGNLVVINGTTNYDGSPAGTPWVITKDTNDTFTLDGSTYTSESPANTKICRAYYTDPMPSVRDTIWTGFRDTSNQLDENVYATILQPIKFT